MRTTKNGSTQYVVLDEGERLKAVQLLSLIGTGWAGQMFLDLVKQTAFHAWPDGKDKDGDPVFRVPSPAEVVVRAGEIVALAEAEMKNRDWCVEMLPAEELLDDTVGRVGFTRSADVQGQGSKALPAAKHPAEADR